MAGWSRTERRRRTRRPGRPVGFTLLEVLVALAIVAVALGAAMRGALALTQAAREARLKLLATITADNELTELRLAGPAPPPGVQRTDCPQGGVHFTCERTVKTTPNPFFLRVQLRVLDDGERPQAELLTVLPASSP